MTRNRLRWVLVASALLVSIGVVVTLAVLPPRQTAHVAVPADDASPEEVAAAYVEALSAHDCETARALLTPSASTWCESVGSIDSVTIGSAREEDPAWSGQSDSTEVAYVPVTLDVDWRLFHDDGSMPEGETSWGYLVVRTEPSSPWRIFDEGVG